MEPARSFLQPLSRLPNSMMMVFKHVTILITLLGGMRMVDAKRFSRGGLVSLNKYATMSSLYQRTTVARLATDGNTNGEIQYCACTVSGAYADSWWSVDLGATYRVKAIQIWNRANCCPYRLTYFDVLVTDVAPPPPIINSSTLCYHHGGDVIPGNIGFYRSCDHDIIGRHVTISKRIVSTEHLTLCEVQVFGVPTTGSPAPRYEEHRPADNELYCALLCSQEVKTCEEYEYNQTSGDCLFHHGTRINPDQGGFRFFQWTMLPEE